jgi:hypothetical protein
MTTLNPDTSTSNYQQNQQNITGEVLNSLFINIVDIVWFLFDKSVNCINISIFVSLK